MEQKQQSYIKSKNNINKISIIIPVHNEARTIGELLKRVVTGCKNISLKKEIIVVNDGSTDNTKEISENFIKNHKIKDIEIKLFNKNCGGVGKGAPLKLGFSKATGDILIIQDADLEYDPNEYKKLIEPIINGETYCVYGSRLKKKNKISNPAFLIGGIAITLATDILFFTNLTDEPTCYKIFHKKLKPIIVNAESNGFELEPEITAKILRKGYKIKEIPISYSPRSAKEGKKIKWQDGFIALKTLFVWRFKKLD
ncbi:MAG: glycosyltransferase family 2 protein [archaeon]